MRVLQVGWESGLISSLYEKERVKRMGWASLVWNWSRYPNPPTEILINYLILMNWSNGTIWSVVGLPISFSTVSWCQLIRNLVQLYYQTICLLLQLLVHLVSRSLMFSQFEVEDFIKQSYLTVCDYELLNYSIQVQGTFPWDVQKKHSCDGSTHLWLDPLHQTPKALSWKFVVESHKSTRCCQELTPYSEEEKQNLFTCRTCYWIHRSYTVLSGATAYPEKEEGGKPGLRQKQTNAPHSDCCEACWPSSRAKFNQ